MNQPGKNISKRNGYQRLLIKIAVFLAIAFVIDYALGGLFHHFYFKQSSGWEYRTKHSIEETKADILIFGASRAQQQYNPVYFEEGLHQTCYNVGRDGEPFFYHYAVLEGVLKRYEPKMIVLDVENGLFRKNQNSYDRISVLLPFYKDHPEMHSIIEMRGPFEKLKLLSKIYPYNSLLFKIAVGNTQFGLNKSDDIKGYVPLDRALNEAIRSVNLSKKYDVDSNKINFYKSFIDSCKDAGIKLYLVRSPYFMQTSGEDISMELAKEIAGERNIRFFDFSKDTSFLNNSRLFDDTVHVNMNGSKIFSTKLVDSIIYANKN